MNLNTTTYSHISLIILNWNGWNDTIECLESVFRNDYPNYQVIVVDNNSSDNSVEYLRAWAEGRLNKWTASDNPLSELSYPPVEKPLSYFVYSKDEALNGGNPIAEKASAISFQRHPLIFIQTGGNLGYAGGNNVGIRYAVTKGDADYIWLLNNDTAIEKTTLSALINEVKGKPNIAICGSVILRYDDPQRIQAFGGGMINKFLSIPRRVMKDKEYSLTNIQNLAKGPEYITGCSMLIRANILADVGLMNEEYFLYWEDTEWCERFKKKGYTLTVSAESRIWHKKGISASSHAKSAFHESYNCLRFFQTYYLPYLPFCLLVRPMMSISIAAKHGNFKYFQEALKGYMSFLVKRASNEKLNGSTRT